MVRILIIDDHPVLRRGLAQLINQESDLKVCGDAPDANEGFEKIKELKPDVAIVDISLDGTDGLDLIKRIKVLMPKLPVLVLSMHDENVYAERVLRAGARGYIMKQEAPELVIAGIRRILKGEYHVSDKMAAKLLSKVADGRDRQVGSIVDRLSDRELEVFTLIGKGLGTRQISDKLCLSVKTVETYRKHIKDKLGLGNATELVCQAVKWAHQR